MKINNIIIDKAIKKLNDYIKSNSYLKLKEILSEPNLTENDITQLLDSDVLMLIKTLTDENIYKFIIENTNENYNKIINETKIKIEKEFDELLKNLLFKSLINSIEIDEEENPLVSQFNIPNGIVSIPLLSGYPPYLIPGIRVGLVDSNDNMLLEMMLQWDDICFLANGFLEIFEAHLEKLKKLYADGQISLPNAQKKKINEFIKKIHNKINTIDNYIKIYGIDI